MADADDDEPTGDETGRGERERSGTRYPFYPLADAFEFAKAIQKSGGNEVREEDLLKHLNLSRTTKSWVYKLSTAREFGLVERKGQKADARIMITELGKRLLLPGDDAERDVTRAAAALTPALYKKLFDHYKGAPVPKATFLANLLVRDHKIVESVATQAAEAFIATAKYAGLVSGPEDVLGEFRGGKRGDEKNDTVDAPPPPPPPPPLRGKTLEVPSDFIAHTFPLRRDLTVTIPLPISLTAKDVKRLKAWMDTLVIDDDDEEEPTAKQIEPT